VGERTGENCCDLCGRRNLCLYRKKKHWNWHRQKCRNICRTMRSAPWTSTLQHCLSVVRISCVIAVGLHIHVNYENLILGALLHDFYLYDWHNHVDEGVLHGFAHPHIACKNAAMRFHVNAEVQHIITTHMWPLTLRFVPRSREAVIVCLADKYCSTLETAAGMVHAAAALFRKRRV